MAGSRSEFRDKTSMCPKCDAVYSNTLIQNTGIENRETLIGYYKCPVCQQLNLSLNGERIYPLERKYNLAPTAVKDQSADLASSYEEAGLLLEISPKSSAALSRRCLQTILREKSGAKHGRLVDEISQVLKSGSLPSYLSDQLDNVRHLGNFAAHPEKDVGGVIIDVNTGEAQHSLEVVEALLEFYYVQPAKSMAATAQIKQKLASRVK